MAITTRATTMSRNIAATRPKTWARWGQRGSGRIVDVDLLQELKAFAVEGGMQHQGQQTGARGAAGLVGKACLPTIDIHSQRLRVGTGRRGGGQCRKQLVIGISKQLAILAAKAHDRLGQIHTLLRRRIGKAKTGGGQVAHRDNAFSSRCAWKQY